MFKPFFSILAMSSDRDGEDGEASLKLKANTDSKIDQQETIELEVFDEKIDPVNETHHEDENIVEAKSLLDHSQVVESAIDESALPTETDLLNKNGEQTGDLAENIELRSLTIRLRRIASGLFKGQS